jgi:squalene-associated FAD-dependent desaturase
VQPDVVVVGAGWAGLTAALTLAEAGVRVLVLEASPHLGGRARRVDHGGVALDNGQHLLIGAYREALALLDRVHEGAPPILRVPLELRVGDEMHVRAPAWRAPWHLAAALARARGLSWRERASAGALMLRLRRRAYSTQAGQTVDALLHETRQPERLRRLLWEPLCVAALNTETHRACARMFAAVLRDTLDREAADSDLVFPAADLGALFPDAAARKIAVLGGEVRTGCPVESVTREGHAYVVRAGGVTARADHVVWATDPARVGAPLRSLPELASVVDTVARLDHAPIVTVYLHYPSGISLPAPMIGATRGAGQWFFDRQALCGQRGWLGAVISAAGPWRGIDRDTLARTVAEEARAVLGIDEPHDDAFVVTEKRATFVAAPGVERPAVRTALARFHLAGDYTASPYPATLETAVRSGLASARAVLEAA